MPVLTWKFCLQENRPYPKFPGMYRGVGVLAGSVAPLTGMQMFFNGVFESWATGRTRSPTDVEVVGCALGAGALSTSPGFTPIWPTAVAPVLQDLTS
jgi:hypothetical protein